MSASGWTAPERPAWIQQLNGEAWDMSPRALVPLEADELIRTASDSLGLSDFGDDRWREPFAVLVKALNEEAELNLFGRLFTRDELLRALKGRLQIQQAYTQHPEIDDEVIDAPVIITGLPRSGTSILFEILAEDPQFGPLLSWEIVLPCPPPEAATYRSDPRIERAEAILTMYDRIAPSFRAMHEMGARLPNECSEAFIYSFMSDNLAARLDIPSYINWLYAKADWGYMYGYHRRLLKLLQWKNPRRHWLLKAPPHLWHLPDLLEVFPDARVVHTHRDPVRCNASNASLLGTLRWMRSDKPFDMSSFDKVLTPEATAAGLDMVIDQIESGVVPRSSVFDVLYADLIDRPLDALKALYTRMGLTLAPEAEQRMQAYIAAKPQGKFGAHRYQTAEGEEERRARACYARYQRHYGVPAER
ncbi:sulfotransferase family protein [Solimonas soli]|uniref:sulfotransferase family protein n=1 Tax=Solimonas soli TaxID=413479 RepID=UPI000486D9EE|nr:sulfotransferase [Solimonas soli]